MPVDQPLKHQSFDRTGRSLLYRIGYFTSSFMDLGDHRDEAIYKDYSNHELLKVDTRLTVRSLTRPASMARTSHRFSLLMVIGKYIIMVIIL